MGKLILVRHGESKLNKANLFFGQLDPELTGKGITQAQKTREVLYDAKYETMYSSPLKRASETASIINSKGLEIKYDDRLMELNFGILEGMTYDEILEKYPQDAKKWEEDWKTYDYRTGESVEELQERVIEFVEGLELGKKKDKNIVVVCHWGVINCILSYYFSGDLDGYWKFSPNYAGIIVIEFVNGYPVLKGLNIGDTDGII